jgi:dolichyl-phosphate beta-glucosyltransferase
MSYTCEMVELSVVIPAYNEEKRLPSTLESVHTYLSERGGTFEIIIVDDGSKDGTTAVVEEFAKHHDDIRLISYSANQGKGHAVRTGILKAHGEKILFNDADGSSPIEELEKLEAALAAGALIAIGSRAKPDPTRKVDALAHRKFIGNSFNTIVKTLVLDGIYDTQCGFKLFTKECAQDIFSVAVENGFAFDVEILFIAKSRGYKTTEIAINWSNVEGSKVNVVLDSMKMLAEVLRISLRSRSGLYKQKKIEFRQKNLALQSGSSKEGCCEHSHH